MRKKLIILSLILLGCVGVNFLAANSSCAKSLFPSCEQIDHSLSATPQNDLQWDEMGLRHLLPTGYKNTTSSSAMGRTQSSCGVSRTTHHSTPLPSRQCVRAATLPSCTADFYVYQLLRLRL